MAELIRVGRTEELINAMEKVGGRVKEIYEAEFSHMKGEIRLPEDLNIENVRGYFEIILEANKDLVESTGKMLKEKYPEYCVEVGEQFCGKEDEEEAKMNVGRSCYMDNLLYAALSDLMGVDSERIEYNFIYASSIAATKAVHDLEDSIRNGTEELQVLILKRLNELDEKGTARDAVISIAEIGAEEFAKLVVTITEDERFLIGGEISALQPFVELVKEILKQPGTEIAEKILELNAKYVAYNEMMGELTLLEIALNAEEIYTKFLKSMIFTAGILFFEMVMDSKTPEGLNIGRIITGLNMK